MRARRLAGGGMVCRPIGRSVGLLACAALWCAGAGSISGAGLPATKPAGDQPNVVVILADDLGWGDIGCHKGRIPTPNIDGFFHKSIELGTFMVTPVCSPTRAALLTGRNPVRVGVAPLVVNAKHGGGLKAEEVTLAEAFRANGYATACIGKWHLGINPPPNGQGFDLFYGCTGAAVDYFARTRQSDGSPDWWENGELQQVEGYTTDLIRDRAVRYLMEHVKQQPGGPFFLYVPFTAVHAPLQAPQAYLARVPVAIVGEDQRTYAAMTIALDDAVGTILATIDSAGLAEQTIVVFTSDNGATPTGSNLPFRGGKHTVYEGGVRAPTAIGWPRRLGGGRRIDALLTIEDLYPTLLAVAGLKPPAGVALDGLDFSPVLLQGAPGPRKSHHWVWRDADAVHTDRWKFIRRITSRELYDLQADREESTNVADQHPTVVAELEAELDAWEASVPCCPTHVPVRLKTPAVAEPSGEVLEVRATVRPGGAAAPLYIELAYTEQVTRPGDRLEYDMMIAGESEKRGFFVDLTNHPRRPGTFEPADACDQYGTYQQPDKGFPQAEGHWARRVIGQAGRCPTPLGTLRIGFTGNKPGQFHFCLDNICIRRASGETIDLFRDSLPDGLRIPRSAAYADVSVRPVPLADARTQ